MLLKPESNVNRRSLHLITLGLLVAGLVLAQRAARALTLEDLERDSKLTPSRFARYFADFNYCFHAEVQRPEVFLATQSGDCDDYAILAAQVLHAKGYTTRLISVRMPGLIHVVCYVAETKCYLDFNNRVYLKRTVGSDGSLPDIARKVAKSFDTHWASAAEFTYDHEVKRLVTTVAADTIKLAAAARP